MPEKIHYEDNLYFLAAFIRALHDAVKLKVDAEFFAEKILEDTFFIDAAIQKIYSSLRRNSRLIQRDSYLHTFMKVKRDYVNFLEDILALQGDFAIPFQGFNDKLRRMVSLYREESRIILEKLQNEKEISSSHEIISSDELQFLMQPMDELVEAQA